ncbi:MAG: hypothetical protein IJS39_02800 [Synergistaceae bacterium]|nr:hypothetical protein [Synergistaceae bacterium]
MNRKIFALCAALVFILACWIIQAGEKHSESPSSEQSSSSEPPSTVQIQDSDSARKYIAVIVDGEDALQANTAEARIVSFLIQNDFSVADEGKMRAVKADAAKYQAVTLAMQENYSAVIRLIADYSLAGGAGERKCVCSVHRRGFRETLGRNLKRHKNGRTDLIQQTDRLH